MVNRQIASEAPKNKDTTKLAKGAGISFVGKMLGRGVHAVNQIVLARVLGPEIFGMYALGWTLMRMTSTIAPLGVNQGVVRYAYRYWRIDNSRLKHLLLQSLSFAFASGLVVGTVLYFYTPWLALRVFHKPEMIPVFRLFIVAIPIVSGLNVAVAATRVSQQMKYAVYVEDLSYPITNFTLIVLFSYWGWGLMGMIAAFLIARTIALIIALIYLRKLYAGVFAVAAKVGVTFRQLVAFSLPTTLASVSILVTLWADRLFIGFFLPTEYVGVYQAITQISVLFTTILTAFSMIFAPMIADLYQAGDIQRLGRLYSISTKWGLYLSLPILLVVVFYPDEVMKTLFGSEYSGGALPLVILSITQIISVGSGGVGYLLVMTDHQNHLLLTSIGSLITNLTLNWLLIPGYGLVGAAVATGIAIGVLSFGSLYFVKRSLKLWPYDWRYGKGLLAAMVAAIAIAVLRSAASPPFQLELFGAAVLSAGTFGGALILFGLDAEDLEVIQSVRRRLGF